MLQLARLQKGLTGIGTILARAENKALRAHLASNTLLLRKLSYSQSLRSKLAQQLQPSTPKSDTTTTPPPPPQNPQLPVFNIDALGLSPRGKKLVIALICVWGVFETWFYGTALWAWWQRRQEQAAAAAAAAQGKFN